MKDKALNVLMIIITGLWIATIVACVIMFIHRAAVEQNTQKEELKTFAFVDASEKWYEEIEYVGFNQFFEEHQYRVCWEENGKAYWKAVDSKMEPSEFILFVQTRENDFLGAGFAK